MDASLISGVILPVIFVVVGISLVWMLVELVLVLRRTRKTVEVIENDMRPILQDAKQVASDAKEMTAAIKPAIDRVDPLMERASLAVDAANLEIMRLDGILENVDSITGSAASATEAIDTVTNAPLKIVNAASDKLRTALSGKKASDESAKLAAAVEAADASDIEPSSNAQASECPEKAEQETEGGYFTYSAPKED